MQPHQGEIAEDHADNQFSQDGRLAEAFYQTGRFGCQQNEDNPDERRRGAYLLGAFRHGLRKWQQYRRHGQAREQPISRDFHLALNSSLRTLA